jgi:predicted CoA-binding protein
VSISFANPSSEAIRRLLATARTIAVVGLSNNPQRPSHEVAAALLDFGYRIVPVNPSLAVWEGIRAVRDLDHAQQPAPDGVDIVNVFRRPEHVAAIVDDCIRLRLPALWLQLGIIDAAAALRAQQAGITVVMNRCIKMDRMRIG